MGSFLGHAAPGAFFIIFSFWWMINLFMRYYKDKSTKKSKFQNTPTFPCPTKFCGLDSFPLEGFFKLLFSVIGCLGEIVWSYRNDPGGIPIGNKQHISIFAFFGLSGAVDLLMQYKDILPPDSDYASMALALGIEFVIFNFHITERSKLGVLLHQILTYTIALNCLAVLAEIKYRRSILAGLAKSYFLFLQGTWFWQIGFILYNPKYHSRWDENNDDNLVMAQMVYCWHVAGCFIFMCCVGSIIAFLLREKNVKSGDYMNLDRLQTNLGTELDNTLMSESDTE